MDKVSVEQRAHDLALLQVQENRTHTARTRRELATEYMENYIYFHKYVREDIKEIKEIRDSKK